MTGSSITINFYSRWEKKILFDSTKMFSISQTRFAAWPWLRINYSRKSESVSFLMQVLQFFIDRGFAYHAKSGIQLQTNTVHCHFCFLKSRQLLWIHDLYAKLTLKCTYRFVFTAVEGRKNYSPERFEGPIHLDLPFWGHLNIDLCFSFPF